MFYNERDVRKAIRNHGYVIVADRDGTMQAITHDNGTYLSSNIFHIYECVKEIQKIRERELQIRLDSVSPQGWEVLED